MQNRNSAWCDIEDTPLSLKTRLLACYSRALACHVRAQPQLCLATGG